MGLINCEVDYISALRKSAEVPVYSVGVDQEQVGKIQGRQFGVLLDRPGGILYTEGPSTGSVARARTLGMSSTKPANADLRVLKGDWTAESAYKAVKSWLALKTSRHLNIRVIGCQNDGMALGARQAFEEVPDEQERRNWLAMPFTGSDGVPETGQEWVRRGLLAATVVIPPTAGLALKLLAKAVESGSQPPAHTSSAPESYPPIEELVSSRRAVQKPPKC